MSEAFESKDPLILDDLIPGCVVWIPEYGYTEDAVFGLRATRHVLKDFPIITPQSDLQDYHTAMVTFNDKIGMHFMKVHNRNKTVMGVFKTPEDAVMALIDIAKNKKDEFSEMRPRTKPIKDVPPVFDYQKGELIGGSIHVDPANGPDQHHEEPGIADAVAGVFKE